MRPFSSEHSEICRMRTELGHVRDALQDVERMLARSRYERKRLAFEYEFAALRFKAALNAHDDMLRKANFNPGQPRVPAGNPDGGQWTDVTEDDRSPDDSLESFSAARRRGRSVAYCMTQYGVDGLLCNSIEQPQRRACWAQAAERLAACLSGRPIPPLNY